MALGMPVGDNISVLTDWVELRVAGTGEDMPLPRLDRMLRAEGSDSADEEFAMDDDELGDDDRELDLDTEDAAAAETDVRVELISAEIDERRRTGAKLYPFGLSPGRITSREAPGSAIYLLLLVLGSGDLPYRADRRAHEVEETYDNVAMAALRRLLGRDAIGLRFARTARDGDEDTDEDAVDPFRRPTNFAAAITWLRDWLDLGKGTRDPAIEVNTEAHWEDKDATAPPLGRAPLSSYNDAGVDVVVWWRFADGRAGFPVLLAQCTVQLAWEQKLEDVKLALWQKWIDFDTVPPQRALVIPFADRRDHPQWSDRTAIAGVILDRIRLLELLDELEEDVLSAMVDSAAQEWTWNELAAA